MKFITQVKAPTSCKAKAIARNLLLKWSYANEATVYIEKYRVGHLNNGNKKVEIEAKVGGYDGHGPIHL